MTNSILEMPARRPGIWVEWGGGGIFVKISSSNLKTSAGRLREKMSSRQGYSGVFHLEGKSGTTSGEEME